MNGYVNLEPHVREGKRIHTLLLFSLLKLFSAIFVFSLTHNSLPSLIQAISYECGSTSILAKSELLLNLFSPFVLSYLIFLFPCDRRMSCCAQKCIPFIHSTSLPYTTYNFYKSYLMQLTLGQCIFTGVRQSYSWDSVEAL